ncbi:sugar ABC transporter substrate-binding protein [Crenobacter sp. SG2303]|uniref:Sugar ABC transporter substrate-binding protein n=1 Tax=Crenobacter oryzisoli TaxID=3056844 RepID=A0ABT7XRS6_9NEIS|nr:MULTISPECIES: sugar ABC transporter substrate-binding protein [unclassified Crenobacter]MDN0076499.1 sugar ABC transporter substrate-binding protein [Crenobacter sp. SG2303]MDN0083267.1 sugar ABC transporter substrate-binding protein [Crenobacter sp. SG2305]
MKSRAKSFLFRGVLAALFASSAVMTAQAASADKPIRIAFVTHGQAGDSYWNALKKGMEDAAKETGAKVSYQAPETFDPIAMARMIDAAVASKVNGLVVTVPDANALQKSIKAADAAGIPVIVVDSGEGDVKKVGAKFYVGSAAEYEAGKLAGERFKAAGAKNPICLNHEVGNVAIDDRCRGFKDGMGGNAPVVAMTMDPTDVTSRVGAYLASHPNTDGILATSSSVANVLIGDLRKKGTLKKYKFASFDVSPELLDGVAKGDVFFALDAQQYMMGYLPVVMLNKQAKYGLLPLNNVYTGPLFVNNKREAEQVLKLSKMGYR